MTILDQETRSDTGPATRAAATAATRTAFRTCPLCEAGCGLEITVVDDRVTRIRGDRDDVFSHGFICPKGSTLKQLHEDPDRVRTPLIKRDGEFQPATWDEAFTEIDRRLSAIVDRHGRQASAAYLGNPGAHSLSPLLYGRPFLKALGTTNIYSASTVDQRPKEVSAALMFGGFFIPVPDVDRTDFLLVLGANPYASNGSLATAPDWPGRIEAIRARGGKLVVVDPRRSRTAEEADEWIAIRPGTDPYLLAAMVRTIVDDGLVDLGTVAEYVTGYDDMVAALAPYDADSVAGLTGIDADTIRRLARELAAAPTAAVYGRIGTTTAEFGTIASWLVDVLNIVTGNLDRPGGAMFATPATGGSSTRGKPRAGKDLRLGAAHVAGPRPGRDVRRVPGGRAWPRRSRPRATARSGRCSPSPATRCCRPRTERGSTPPSNSSSFMVSIDIYVNETTRHADVILPAPSVLQKQHYDLALLQLGLRNVANWSEPVFPLDDDQLDEWEILAKLALIAQGIGADADPAVVDDLMIRSMVDGAVADEHGPLSGRDPDDVLAAARHRAPVRRGSSTSCCAAAPTATRSATSRTASPSTRSIARPTASTSAPLVPRLPDGLRTPSGMIELAPEPILADVPRMRGQRSTGRDDGFVLVGRRDLRSNNSWMHNIEVLVKGKPRCTLHVHPDDADRARPRRRRRRRSCAAGSAR